MAASYITAGLEDVIGLIVFAIFALVANGIRKGASSKSGSQQSTGSAGTQSSAQDELTKFLQSIAQAQEQAVPPPVPVQAREASSSAGARAQRSARGARTMRTHQRASTPQVRQQADDMPHEPITAPAGVQRDPAPEIAPPMELTVLHSSVASFDADAFRNGASLRKAVVGMEILGKPVALRGPLQ